MVGGKLISWLACFVWDVRNGRDDFLVDVDASQEDVLVEEFIVVVQQDGRVVDGREADRRDADFSHVAAVRSPGEDSWAYFQVPAKITQLQIQT